MSYAYNFVYQGKSYPKGTVIIRASSDQKEIREVFVHRSLGNTTFPYLVMNLQKSFHSGLVPRQVYTEKHFFEGIIRFESPTPLELSKLKELEKDFKPRIGLSDDSTQMLLLIGLIVLFAALPPVGLVVLLCIVFSDKTVSGFIGCLTPFLILVAIAALMMLFD